MVCLEDEMLLCKFCDDSDDSKKPKSNKTRDQLDLYTPRNRLEIRLEDTSCLEDDEKEAQSITKLK